MKRPSLNTLRLNKQTAGYLAILAASLVLAIVSGAIATPIDDYAYDWMFRLHPPTPAPPHTIILAIDDATFSAMGGVREYRSMLAKGLELLATAHPKVIAIDLILADKEDPIEDARLRQAIQNTPNLVLATHLQDGRWENPQPEFMSVTPPPALGHDTSDELSRDGVTRRIPLQESSRKEQHWALALEAFRLAHGGSLVQSLDDLQIGPIQKYQVVPEAVIPAPRGANGNRPLRIIYSLAATPQVSIKELADHPALASRFTGQAVFVGVTSINATYDRVTTPYAIGRIPGVDVHANLYETLERGQFLVDASNLAVLGFCIAACVVAGLIFALLSGWAAYLSAGALLIAAHVAPYVAFRHGIVFPYFAPLASAWLASAAAASYQHFVVRRQLRSSETERKRYQQAIHFVTHEMRTPLTAIQGSSELMGRYNLTEEKRKQIADMINQESKRLARMIQTFLDVERLSDGQMELKRDHFSVRDLVEACLVRVQPLAERKNIVVKPDVLDGTLEGDRELMEYAVYNLLTNGVKYSGPGTTITVWCLPQGGQLRLSVQDQGIGMDARELRQIFQKFYRTKRAEASGEAGTGIGLSIVDQIVTHHGGKMEVTSEPGKGSCFTMVLPALSRVQPPGVSV